MSEVLEYLGKMSDPVLLDGGLEISRLQNLLLLARVSLRSSLNGEVNFWEDGERRKYQPAIYNLLELISNDLNALFHQGIERVHQIKEMEGFKFVNKEN